MLSRKADCQENQNEENEEQENLIKRICPLL